MLDATTRALVGTFHCRPNKHKSKDTFIHGNNYTLRYGFPEMPDQRVFIYTFFGMGGIIFNRARSSMTTWIASVELT